MITVEEAKRLLSKQETPSISKEEAKKLLDEDRQNMTLYPSPGLSAEQTSNFTKSLLAGLLKFGQGVGELQAKGLRTLGFPIKPLEQTMASNEATGINRLSSNTPEGKIGEFIGSSIPYLTPTAATKASIELAPKVIPHLTKELLKQAGILGLTSPISQPEVSIPEAEKNTFTDPLAYLALGASPALTGIGSVFSKGRNALAKLGGTSKPEEVIQRMKAAGETPLPLGEAVQSPFLKSFQSSGLSLIPGSGMAKKYQEIGESLSNRANSVLNDLNQFPLEDLGTNLGKQLQEARASARRNNQILHNNFAEEADKLGIKVKPKEYIDVAREKLKEIQKHESSNPELSPLKKGSDQKMKSLLEKISKGIPEKDFKSASLVRAKLNDAMDTAESEGNNYHIGILNSLKKAWENDIENSAMKSGYKGIYDKYLEAKKDYANNVAPFETGELAKFSKPTSNADTDTIIQTFIKTGKTDRPKLLSKLTNNLDKDSISQIAFKYLNQGNDTLDKKLTAYSKLGEKTKNILFNLKQKEELDNILSTRKLMNKDIDQMLSPKTGEKAAKYLGLSGLGGAIVAALSGHPAALVGGAGLSLGSNLAKRALMSDFMKNRYIQAALRKQNAKPRTISRYPLLSYPVYIAYQQGENQQ